ncbi:hypothetical protein CGRA01v4_06388 [Colletotrichum graminicola]|nr:hypothetical protein CGRA01v4_06388 [Colletotrichum graminicola]
MHTLSPVQPPATSNTTTTTTYTTTAVHSYCHFRGCCVIGTVTTVTTL